MPVVIIMSSEHIPAIIARETSGDLIAAVRDVVSAPKGIESRDQVEAWLAKLPAPSGWFDDEDEAMAYVKRTDIERDAQLLRAALDATGWTQRAMADALGLADPRKDGSAVRKVLLGKNGLSGSARRSLAYALEHGAMDKERERQILDRLRGGTWRTVPHAAIRRNGRSSH